MGADDELLRRAARRCGSVPDRPVPVLVGLFEGWLEASDERLHGVPPTVTGEAIEVHSLGRFGRRLLELMAPGAKLRLTPRETTMGTLQLGQELGPRRGYIALTCKQPDDSDYTLAVRPSDGDVDRLRNALKSAGVREF